MTYKDSMMINHFEKKHMIKCFMRCCASIRTPIGNSVRWAMTFYDYTLIYGESPWIFGLCDSNEIWCRVEDLVRRMEGNDSGLVLIPIPSLPLHMSSPVKKVLSHYYDNNIINWKMICERILVTPLFNRSSSPVNPSVRTLKYNLNKSPKVLERYSYYHIDIVAGFENNQQSCTSRVCEYWDHIKQTVSANSIPILDIFDSLLTLHFSLWLKHGWIQNVESHWAAALRCLYSSNSHPLCIYVYFFYFFLFCF